MHGPWVLLVLVGLIGVYTGFDAFRGKMLGIVVGTTVDPRGALGTRSFSMSMEPQIFELEGRHISLGRNGKEDVELPEIRLAIPKAYVDTIRYKEKRGWFGEPDVHNVEMTLSSQNFEPYRLERARLHKEVLDQLGIELITRLERYPMRFIKLGDDNELVFPSDEAQARYEAEMLRRGFTEIIGSVSASARSTPEERTGGMLWRFFRDADQLSPFEALEGCVASPGPYPNSVRYDHSPEALAQAPEGSPNVRSSCLRLNRNAFGVVEYDKEGHVSMTMICREYGRVACTAVFYWRDLWRSSLYVSLAYLKRIPEFIEKLKTLYDTFERPTPKLEGRNHHDGPHHRKLYDRPDGTGTCAVGCDGASSCSLHRPIANQMNTSLRWRDSMREPWMSRQRLAYALARSVGLSIPREFEPREPLATDRQHSHPVTAFWPLMTHRGRLGGSVRVSLL